MKKLLILLVPLFFLSGCGGDSIVIESEAPGVSLEIPKAALPDGVSKGDITISLMESDEIPIAVEGATLMGYRLEPDGLEFGEDVMLKLELDQPAFPTFFHISEDNFEFLTDIHYLIEEGKTTVSVPVSHFSMVIDARGDEDPFIFSSSASDIFEGEKTDVTLVTMITNWDYDNGIHYPGIGQRIIDGTQTIRAKLFRGDNLTPISVDIPTSAFGEKYTIHTDDFTCTKPGPTYIEFSLTIKWDYDPTGIVGTFGSTVTGLLAAALGKDYVHSGQVFVDTKVPFECKPVPPPPPPPKCGNDKIETGEDCDGKDLARKTCKDFGFEGGTLGCDSECYFDTYGCINVHELGCNENTWEDETDLWEYWSCKDDCPVGQTCNAATCTCESETTTGTDEESSVALPGLEKEDQGTVKVIKVGEEYIPADQIHSFTGAECDKQAHWHPNEATVTTLSGKKLSDPNPDSCGFGKVSEHPVIEVPSGDFKVEVRMGF